MKKLFEFMQLLIVLFFSGAPVVYGQPAGSTEVDRVATTQDLFLSTRFTTVLVFNAAICEGCVDRGHFDIATSQVAGMRNVLRVKAKSVNLPASNLTVFTTDGRMYTFKVWYNDEPPQTMIRITDEQPAIAQFSMTRLSQDDIEQYAKITMAAKADLKRPKSKSVGRMNIRLVNLLQKDGVLFFKFSISNRSGIDYDVNFSRFYIRDKRVGKRTAIMEQPLDPLYLLLPRDGKIPKNGKADCVIAMEKFTIADHKYFVVELFEKNGDRPLLLNLKGRTLLNARSD